MINQKTLSKLYNGRSFELVKKMPKKSNL